MSMQGFTTRFPKLAQRMRLAHQTGGYIVLNGELMEIVAFAEVDDTIIADMVPAIFPPSDVPDAMAA